MPNGPSLGALRRCRPSASRSTSRRRRSPGPLLRASLLGAGVAYALMDFRAQRMAAALTDGTPRTAEAFFAASLDAARAFPFDRGSRWAAISVMRAAGAQILEGRDR